MGWVISALLALLVVSLLALALPTLFGPVVAGAAPLLVVIAIIGLGGIWWRRARHRVDPQGADEPTPDQGAAEPVRGEDDPVET